MFYCVFVVCWLFVDDDVIVFVVVVGRVFYVDFVRALVDLIVDVRVEE